MRRHSSSTGVNNTSTSAAAAGGGGGKEGGDHQARPLRVLMVPLCCDWNGLNDQFAMGTHMVIKSRSPPLKLF
jgi:hypothetical protein